VTVGAQRQAPAEQPAPQRTAPSFSDDELDVPDFLK
jgi:hypothetical protein